MAKKMLVQLACDITGATGDDVTTVRFGWEGREYEIELCGEAAAPLMEVMGKLVPVARRIPSRGNISTPRTRQPASSDQPATSKTNPNGLGTGAPGPGASPERLWWAANATKLGMPFRQRGAIPKDVQEAYQASAAALIQAATSNGATNGKAKLSAADKAELRRLSGELENVVKTVVPPAGKTAQRIKEWWGGLTAEECKKLGIEPRKTPQYGRVPAPVAEAYERHLAKTNK